MTVNIFVRISDIQFKRCHFNFCNQAFLHLKGKCSLKSQEILLFHISASSGCQEAKEGFPGSGQKRCRTGTPTPTPRVPPEAEDTSSALATFDDSVPGDVGIHDDI